MRSRLAIDAFLVPFLAFIGFWSAPAAAQDSVANFYRGKVIRILLSAGEGGGYNTYASAILPFMQKYLPGNPTIIIQHMPGAGGVVAANYMYNVAPHDGTMIALIHRSAVSTAPLFGSAGIKYDPRKFGWVGSMNNEKSLCVVWNTSKVRSFEDLTKIAIPVAGQGPGGDPDLYTNFLNNVFGTKMRLITGYDSGEAMSLALERGEVEGRCHWSWSAIAATKMSWITEKKIRLIVQLAFEKHPDLPDVPLITDYVKTDEQRQLLEIIVGPSLMGRPFLVPPDIPADRLKALRAAFVSSMKDPDFIAHANAENLEYSMVTGEEIDALIGRMYSAPKDIVEKAAQSVEHR
jgi:tripartite-type tricarboxylate transporter receptor subunit TctC